MQSTLAQYTAYSIPWDHCVGLLYDAASANLERLNGICILVLEESKNGGLHGLLLPYYSQHEKASKKFGREIKFDIDLAVDTFCGFDKALNASTNCSNSVILATVVNAKAEIGVFFVYFGCIFVKLSYKSIIACRRPHKYYDVCKTYFRRF